MRTSISVGIPVLLCACASENSPIMKPGQDCTRCHDGDEAPKWTAAGTVFPEVSSPADAGLEGVAVVVTDAGGRSITMTSNSAGNFYTAEPLTPPLDAHVEKDGHRIVANAAVPRGGCNDCHSVPPKEETRGRLYWSPP
jgi:hypothetical protein